MDASIRQFCASANARLQACADFDARRRFLVDHVERVIYKGYKVTIAGSVAVQSASGETKLPFRIRGEIDRNVVRSPSRRSTPDIGPSKGWTEKLAASPIAIGQVDIRYRVG
jgi:hypothetical protein